MASSILPLGGVIGTAGHIDHGKTALVRALTGVETDRLKEEKARGITIELGFAHLVLPSGRTVGVVDVPGHERYVRTMVAGAVGIDLVVLVVAADEGVMPQTREHLDICELLGIRRGIVALTKIDAVEPELRALAESEVRAALSGGFLDAAPIIACSSVSGEGLDPLRAAIDVALASEPAPGAWPAPARDAGGLLRLPIDRVFSMKGFGSVVTGTLWSGRVSVGDEVELYPGDVSRRGKVRGLQCHGGPVEAVEAGRRVALNLPLPREALERGLVLGHEGALEAGTVFDAQLLLLPSTRRPFKRRSQVLLHAGTAQVDATIRLLEGERLEPGARAFVEVELQHSLVLAPGDRFVLRGFELQKGHGTTLGGGVVVRVLGRRSRRGARTEPALLADNLAAHAAGDHERRVQLEIERAGRIGLARGALLRRVPEAPRLVDMATARLASRRAVFRFDREREAWIGAPAFGELRERALAQVKAQAGATGLPREALRAQVTADPRLLHLVLESLLTEQGLVADRDRLRLPGEPVLVRDDLGERVYAILDEADLQPPRTVELADLVGAPSQREIDRVIEALVRGGRVVRTKELSFARARLDALRARLVAYLDEHGEIDAQAWKSLCGGSRKFSIPLAEHFDAERVTLRVGDLRRLR